jgi:hypothetical protein
MSETVTDAVTPENINIEVWTALSESTKKDFLNAICPKEIKMEVWQNLNYSSKSEILDALKKEKDNTTSNPYLVFIDECTTKIIPTSDSINTMALICALVLTIPYGVMSFINGEWFNEFQTKLSLCTESDGIPNYHDFYVVMNNNLALCIYSSLINLMLVALYYAMGNGDLDGNETITKRLRLKLMLVFMVCTLTCSIVGLMDVTSLLWRAYMNDNICDWEGNLTDSIWVTGTALVTMTIPLSLVLSW